MVYNTQLQCLHYSRKSLQAIHDFHTTHIFVRFIYSPLIHLLYIELGLLYTADEQTFQAVAQWRPKTESRTVFGVYSMPERPIPVAVQTKMCVYTATRSQRLWDWIPQGVWMSVCCKCCVLSGRGLQQASHPSRKRLPSMQCPRRGLHEAALHATRQQIQSPTSERAGSKLVMPVTHT
jgi:hypothetical protein